MILFGIFMAFTFVTMILFVMFGQITVRKLRKSDATKSELGIEFAQALAVPLSIMRKLKNSPLSGLYADPDLLRQHTGKFDKVLAVLFYWLFIFSGLSGALLVLLNALGVFN